ncbi:MAG: MarR family transcriptional regulator [Nitriliruptorales bacterium]|nr:MarR family transcriptional regulator [Nitriliruptorales bacterium]
MAQLRWAHSTNPHHPWSPTITSESTPGTTSGPAPEILDAVERLRRVAGRMWSRIEDEFGISDVQASVLEAVAGGARQVSAVADHCGRHVSSASRVVDALVGRGLLNRSEDPDDRRAVHLTLTDEGERIAQRILAAHAEVLSRSLEQLGPEDGAQFLKLLRQFSLAAEKIVDDVPLH